MNNINSSGATKRAIAVVGDVTNQTYIDHLVKQAAEFGNGKIHIIINNAGFTWDAVIHKVWDIPNLLNSLVECCEVWFDSKFLPQEKEREKKIRRWY
jgi:NAD(P)-dependent dehydrogenase (short-subunit alcohol dehydrogenase family)